VFIIPLHTHTHHARARCRWYAGIKENDANSDRGVYDAWTGGMQHMNGVMFFASGLFSLWASSDSEGFTFFTGK